MKNYLDLLQHVRDHGVKKTSRGVIKGSDPNAPTSAAATRSVFAPQLRFNLQEGFPLVTTKRVPFNAIVHELLWFISGSTNVKYLHENNVHIWDSWVDKNGDLGPVYGKQWRFCNAADKYDVGDGGIIDQLANVIDGLKKNPDGRRHIVSAWNVADLPAMRLPPCHVLFQFYVTPPEPRADVDTIEVLPGEYTTVSPEQALRAWVPGRTALSRPRLHCQLYQRSADLFLGVPFNIASYALLTHMVAQVCGFDVGEFILTFGDAHIYENHLDAVDAQLARVPRALPTLGLDPGVHHIDNFRFGDVTLFGYEPEPAIKATVVV